MRFIKKGVRKKVKFMYKSGEFHFEFIEQSFCYIPNAPVKSKAPVNAAVPSLRLGIKQVGRPLVTAERHSLPHFRHPSF